MRKADNYGNRSSFGPGLMFASPVVESAWRRRELLYCCTLPSQADITLALVHLGGGPCRSLSHTEFVPIAIAVPLGGLCAAGKESP